MEEPHRLKNAQAILKYGLTLKVWVRESYFMKIKQYITLLSFILIVIPCSEEERNLSQLNSSFDISKDYLMASDDNSSLSLNFIDDTHWFKGEFRDSEGAYRINGIQFNEGIASKL